MSWFCQGVTDTILPIPFAEQLNRIMKNRALSSPMYLVVDFILTLAVSIMIGLILKCGRDCFIRKEGV